MAVLLRVRVDQCACRLKVRVRLSHGNVSITVGSELIGVATGERARVQTDTIFVRVLSVTARQLRNVALPQVLTVDRHEVVVTEHFPVRWISVEKLRSLYCAQLRKFIVDSLRVVQEEQLTHPCCSS